MRVFNTAVWICGSRKKESIFGKNTVRTELM